jgi:hypothetical protein
MENRGSWDRDHAVGMGVGMYIMLRRRAAAAFMRTKPSGRMEARSLPRTVLVIRFHRRIRRRSRRLVVEREGLGLGILHTVQWTRGGAGFAGQLGQKGSMRIEEPWDLPRLLVPDGGGGYGYDGCGSFVSDNWASHLGRVWVWVWV